MISALLVAASLVFTGDDAALAFSCASNIVKSCTPRDAGTVRGVIASNWILDHASMEGLDVNIDRFVAKSPSGERQFVNLYAAIKRNPRGKWVVLVSHYDTKPGVDCPGANDGASTSGLLIALGSCLRRTRDFRGNVLLVWTDGEECVNSYSENDGFQGSKRAAGVVRDSGIDVRAVICLDMLGDRDLQISIPDNVNHKLAKIAMIAAERAKLKGLLVNSKLLVKDDHVAFAAEGYPAIDLIDFDYGSARGLNDWWHTPEDTIDKISVKSLEKSGRLVTALLTLLFPDDRRQGK